MIRLDSPRNGDIVGEPIALAGYGSGFEAVINYRISEGHDQLEGYISVGGGSGEHAQFCKGVEIARTAMKMPRILVEVFEASAKDGSDLHKRSRWVYYGPHLVEGYYGYREHIVEAGESLSEIAREHYGTNETWPIATANGLTEPDLIFPGQLLRIPVGT